MAGGFIAGLMHAEFLGPFGKAHDQRVAAYMIVEEGAQAYAQGAGDFE